MSYLNDEEVALSEDIYKVLKQREEALPKYKGCSSQLCFRRYLVDWLAVISEKLNLAWNTSPSYYLPGLCHGQI